MERVFVSLLLFFFIWRDSSQWARVYSATRFLHTTTHYSRYDSSGRVISSSQIPLPNNTHTHNHNRQTSMHPVGFEPTISAGERPQSYALGQCFSTFVRPRPGKIFFHKMRARSQKIYSQKLSNFFLSSYIKLI